MRIIAQDLCNSGLNKDFSLKFWEWTSIRYVDCTKLNRVIGSETKNISKRKTLLSGRNSQVHRKANQWR
ncbi:hypothetical protein B9Z55_001585 [Caenorhabditis nigoni]|nr:hypothetical protein B9Z55_001585 [Caenorhabditis nigoni]